MTRLAGSFELAVPPERAFALFTPLGERAWALGWEPWFPTPVTDDSAPGTVFQTDAHGRKGTWIVVQRTPPRGISYARVIDGQDAGTVTVELEPSAGGTSVHVTYDLTPLTDAGARHLDSFASSYAHYLESWQAAIAALT
jgi:uncharacterized protein YndB with AHSA1/START domain